MFGLALLGLAVLGAGTSHASSVRTEHGWGSFYVSSGITASGERLRTDSMTAAHRTLAFGSIVTITNHMNDKSVIVTINDRGPFIRGRIVDLATKPAKKVGLPHWGVARVTLAVLCDAKRYRCKVPV
jgi:rare lipoprotein A